MSSSSGSRGSGPWTMNGGRGQMRVRAVSGCCFGQRIRDACGGTCVTSSSAKSRRRSPTLPRARAWHQQLLPRRRGAVARGGNHRAGDSGLRATVSDQTARRIRLLSWRGDLAGGVEARFLSRVIWIHGLTSCCSTLDDAFSHLKRSFGNRTLTPSLTTFVLMG
jgi:hypothetical protein